MSSDRLDRLEGLATDALDAWDEIWPTLDHRATPGSSRLAERMRALDEELQREEEQRRM